MNEEQKMKVTFLGTGTSQGVPVIACHCPVCSSSDPRDQRLRSSVFVEAEGMRIVIDCGPDFRQQMLREKIESIDAIFVTHNHKDHLGGIDDVRAFNYIQQKPTAIYAGKNVHQQIIREYKYAFSGSRYPGVPDIHLHTILRRPIFLHLLRVHPIIATHYEPDQTVFGFRIGDFTYLTDVYRIDKEEKKKIMGSKVVVVNALRKAPHHSHLNLEGALALLDELKPERGYLTHISHQMGLHAEVEKELPGNISLAYDRLSITI